MDSSDSRIRYARTDDDVSIAYWTDGEGTPFVHMSPAFPFTHLQLEWQVPGWKEWCAGLAGLGKLVRFDPRGGGLSDHNVANRSLETYVRDLEAVADHLGLERFALLGVLHSGPVAVAYAARHPERVSHLVLWCTYAKARDLSAPSYEAVRMLLEKDWQVYCETLAHVLFGWSEGEAQQFASFIPECVSQEEARRLFDVVDGFDVDALLGQVRVPTLVVQRRAFPFFDMDVARRLTAGIPDARLAVLEGGSLCPWMGDAVATAQLIGGFLLDAAAPTRQGGTGGVRTVLFTDIVGHTEMMRRLGDARGRDVLREHERITRETLKQHGGTEVKTMGDGFMASFGSVTAAMECAIALQRAFNAWNAGERAQQAAPLHVRVGLNAGEPIEEDGDLFGSTVILASRIAAKADADEILIPEPVRHLLSGKSYVYADRGETVLKGFENAVRLYEVRWRE